MKKKTNIVVGICSCHGTGDKRKAVRSTCNLAVIIWMSKNILTR